MAKFITFVFVLFFNLVVACDVEVLMDKVVIENHHPVLFTGLGEDPDDVETVLEAVSDLEPYPVADVSDQEEVHECMIYGNDQFGYHTSWIDGDISQPIQINNQASTISQRGFLGVLYGCGQGYIVRRINVALETHIYPPQNLRFIARVGKKVVVADCKSFFEDGGPNVHHFLCGYENPIDVAVRPGEVVDFFYQVEGIPPLSQNTTEWTLFRTSFSLEDIETGDWNAFVSGAPQEFVWID